MEQQSAKQPRAERTRGQKLLAAAGIAAFFLLLALVAIFAGGPLVKTLGEPESFRAWVDARGAAGKLLFVGLVALQVIVAFIPGEPFELAAGYAFGAVTGTALVSLGVLIGGVCVFLFVRHIGFRAVEVFFPREKIDSVRYLRDEKTLGAAAFLLFLIPGTPKDLLTYLAGLTRIRLLPWILITSVARLPSIITSTVSGAALGVERYGLAAVVYGATALVSGAAMLLWRRAERKKAFAEAGRALASQPLAEPPPNDPPAQ